MKDYGLWIKEKPFRMLAERLMLWTIIPHDLPKNYCMNEI